MNILAFDTSTDILTVELSTAAGRFYDVRDCGLRHSELLAEAIGRLHEAAAITPAELDLIACGRGPGSFTGLRIGMATAKGLAAGLGKPFVTVPTLDLFAYGFEWFRGTVVSVIDAKKRRFYAAFYERGAKLTADLDIPAEEIVTRLSDTETVLYTGPHADAVYRLESGRDDRFLYPLHRRGNPGGLTALAERIFQNEGPAGTDASPVYIRQSEAERSTGGPESHA
jgi:tRNA threonylcarbamoyladenosine biosynthesis protein TsaB